MYQPLIKFHPYPAIITQVLRIFVALECIFNTFGSKYITFGHFITFRI